MDIASLYTLLRPTTNDSDRGNLLVQTVARDVDAGPACVLGAQTQAGSAQLVAAVTANAARCVDLAAALPLHEVGVVGQRHRRTRPDCNAAPTHSNVRPTATVVSSSVVWGRARCYTGP